MRSKLLLVFLLFTFINATAKHVDVVTAMQAANNFYALKASANKSIGKQPTQLSLIYECKSVVTQQNASNTGESLYYVFNINSDGGFIIVSADDVAVPVLGYTTSGSFHSDHLPPAFQKWLQDYKTQLLYAKAKFSTATYAVKSCWDELLDASNTVAYRQMTQSTVSPLLTTTWDQEPYYNDLCPYDPAAPLNDHVPTGCVATAMAQIMKYWNYPAQGTGFHSYYSDNYGTLSADFSSTTYNWSSMPNSLSSSNTNIATLMYQCGVSVEMNYAPDGSGAYVIAGDDPVCSQSAYITYFGYDNSSIQGLRRDDIGDFDSWKTTIKNELNNARPVQYVGFGSGGGHTWVCDGYDANDYFHMNWGWGGAGPNGYYALDALNPPALGTGGGDGGFNYGQEALIGIKPTATASADNIALYADMTVSVDPIFCIDTFSVNVPLYNAGTAGFVGNFSAALFTSSGDFVQYIQVLSTGSYTLPAGYGYSGGVTFRSDGTFIQPGDYQLGIYYQSSGGGWQLVTGNGYTNPINVTVVGPYSNLCLYSDIETSPTTFVQGSPASVTANIANTYPFTYYGTYIMGLFDLTGAPVEVIDSITESDGLPSNSYYTSPLSFTTSDITVPPGTYVLGCFQRERDSVFATPAGSQYYPNPVIVNVVAAGLGPDIYEPDNDLTTAYPLAMGWSVNASNPKTAGSNLHLSSDLDYYKLVLPGNYNYTISARTNDAFDSDDGNTYTADVLWSYNTGSGWSTTYRNEKYDNIVLYGAHTVYFKVAPYFSGSIGSYLFKAHVTRTPATGVNNLSAAEEGLAVYPNPTSDLLYVKVPGGIELKTFYLFNSLGQVVSLPQGASLPVNHSLDVADLPTGIYNLEAITADKKYFARFVINR